ncbi:MAG: TetR/AcrR family transcriptional regulator [Rubricella sp.]
MVETSELVRKGRKYEQVLDGARDVFMAQGYEGASVDDIARAASVSKATLYSYFPDKSILFREVMLRECRLQSERMLPDHAYSAPPRETLLSMAREISRFLVSPFPIKLFRVCIAESFRFPDVGQAFYETGPRLMRDRFVAYLKMCSARGQLAIEDYELAAEQFAELAKADLFVGALLGIDQNITDDRIERIANGAVDTFLARYGTEAS